MTNDKAVNYEYVTLEKTQHEILEAPIKVYNFEVEDYHTYFVGNDGVLVHNACAYKNDYSTNQTVNKSVRMNSQGQARALARQKIGRNPVQVGTNKWRSANGVWQYRAKPGDLAKNYIHLERINPKTGWVNTNWHLRW